MPFVVAQATKNLHELNEDVQTSPVVAASQSAVPQAQLTGLAAEPSVVLQVGAGLQRPPLDVSQKSPVADVQAPEVPQKQGAELAALPLLWGQMGPVTAAHKQALELEWSQESVESVYVLKNRLPPLLLLLMSKHPRG